MRCRSSRRSSDGTSSEAAWPFNPAHVRTPGASACQRLARRPSGNVVARHAIRRPGGVVMRLRIRLSVAVLVAALMALPGLAARTAAVVVVYTVKTLERHDPACRPSRSDRFSCPHILFEYPVIHRAPTPAAAAALNRAVRDYLLTSYGEPRKYHSPEEAMEAFMQEYEDYFKTLTGAPNAFWLEKTVAILYQSPAIVSIKFDTSAYTGGAHPNYAATFTSFNATTGGGVTLDEVLVAGYRPRLTRIAENEFRARHDIKPGMTLRDAGYVFFKNDTFALNDNFWFGPDGVTFFYNNYEIAPYAMGPTDVLLTYPAIRELIRPDGLLRPMR